MPGFRAAVLFLALTSLLGLTSGQEVYQDAVQEKLLVNRKCPDYCHLHPRRSRATQCNIEEFLHRIRGDYWGFLYRIKCKCNEWGSCNSECRTAVRLLCQHPCLQEDFRNEVQSFVEGLAEGLAVIRLAKSCPEESFCLKASAGIPKGGVLGLLLVLLVVTTVLM